MENNKRKAFRAVYAEYADFYFKGQTDNIPGLEGSHYIKAAEERCNNFDYDPNTRYLHFFENLHDAKEFAKIMNKKYPGRKVVILKFELPEELTQKSYKGRYFSFADEGDVDREEFIFPAEKYRASFCKGEASEEDREKGKVYYDPDGYLTNGGGIFGL